MPGVTVGVYTGQLEAGTQVSSTYEGRHITVREDELIHPYIADGYVNKGDPVVVCDAAVPTTYGNLVGVAFDSGAAAADLIAVDTEGIWNLKVDAYNDAGGVAVEIGDPLYIRAGSLSGATSVTGIGDADISKRTDNATQVFFGYALGSMESTGSGRIAVKVHASPWPEQEERRYQTVATGAYSYGFHQTAILAAGQSTGLNYSDSQVGGQQAGGIYNFSSWMETQTGFIASAALLVAGEFGIYDTVGTLTLSRIVMLQLQGIIASNPASLHIMRVNIAAAGGAITAFAAFANPTSAGYVANALTTATLIGHMPFADIVGASGIGWIRLYDGAT